MPIIESSNDFVSDLSDLHLFHTDISNCCDRVRIALEEKKLKWNNHFYVLPRGDHLTAEFFSINPKGSVPVLVHDGVVVTESNDIIEYLDAQFPEPPLQPTNSDMRKKVYGWMKSADAYHIYIAALSFEFLFKVRPYDQVFFERRAKMRAHTNDAMKQLFEPGSHVVDSNMVKQGIVEANNAFKELEAALVQGGPWLLGEQFTLADITWAVQIHRLKTLNLRDIDQYPSVVLWYNNLEQRDSIKCGMLDWETTEAYVVFANYVEQRCAEGTDVNAACWRN